MASHINHKPMMGEKPKKMGDHEGMMVIIGVAPKKGSVKGGKGKKRGPKKG